MAQSEVPTGAIDPGSPGDAADGRPLKVRVGFGLGVRTTLYDDRYGFVVDELERLGFDSLWLSERLATASPDPLAAIGFGLGRTKRLKFGMSVLVLPGRNPVVLAKQLATLSTMSGGRLLPAFGMGAAEPREHAAFGVDPAERAGRMMEAIEVMRRAWTGEPFDFDGEFFQYRDVRVRPAPTRMDVWLGGEAPSTLRRVGQVADGWLPSFTTPDDAAAGRVIIEQAAADAGRSIEPDHFGVLIPYVPGRVESGHGQPDEDDPKKDVASADVASADVASDHSGAVPAAMIELLAKRKPGVPIADIVPSGWGELRDLIQRFVAVGTTKFVVLPVSEPTTTLEWTAHLERLAAEVLPLET